MIVIWKYAVLILATAGLVLTVINASKEHDDIPLQKIQEDVEFYDNWAVFAVNKDNKIEFDNYVAKMLEEAENIDIISSYRLEIEVTDESDWLKNNSWRFGFIMREPGVYRYVGVFPAEQMYYSGLRLEEYLEKITE